MLHFAPAGNWLFLPRRGNSCRIPAENQGLRKCGPACYAQHLLHSVFFIAMAAAVPAARLTAALQQPSAVRIACPPTTEKNSMPDQQDGRRFQIPRSRRLTWDLLWFHRRIPLCPHERQLQLQAVAAARAGCSVRISWAAIFMRTTGLLSAEFPELRQIWYRWPWAHLYQHPHSVGILTVQREMNGEAWLFWGRIVSPESLQLTEIQQRIDQFRERPPGEVFSRMLQLAALPFPLRRLVWWWNLNLATSGRARRLGTFFLSTLAGQGAEIPLPPSVQTACLSWGPLRADQTCRFTMAYDHRVFDGMLASRMLARIQELLDQQIAAELQQLSCSG